MFYIINLHLLQQQGCGEIPMPVDKIVERSCAVPVADHPPPYNMFRSTRLQTVQTPSLGPLALVPWSRGPCQDAGDILSIEDCCCWQYTTMHTLPKLTNWLFEFYKKNYNMPALGHCEAWPVSRNTVNTLPSSNASPDTEKTWLFSIIRDQSSFWQISQTDNSPLFWQLIFPCGENGSQACSNLCFGPRCDGWSR